MDSGDGLRQAVLVLALALALALVLALVLALALALVLALVLALALATTAAVSLAARQEGSLLAGSGRTRWHCTAHAAQPMATKAALRH